MVLWHTAIDRNYNIGGPPLAYRHVKYSPFVTWQNQIHVILLFGAFATFMSAQRSGIHARWSDSKIPGVNSVRYNLIILLRVARISRLSSCAAPYIVKLWLKSSISPISHSVTSYCHGAVHVPPGPTGR